MPGRVPGHRHKDPEGRHEASVCQDHERRQATALTYGDVEKLAWVLVHPHSLPPQGLGLTHPHRVPAI